MHTSHQSEILHSLIFWNSSVEILKVSDGPIFTIIFLSSSVTNANDLDFNPVVFLVHHSCSTCLAISSDIPGSTPAMFYSPQTRRAPRRSSGSVPGGRAGCERHLSSRTVTAAWRPRRKPTVWTYSDQCSTTTAGKRKTSVRIHNVNKR